MGLWVNPVLNPASGSVVIAMLAVFGGAGLLLWVQGLMRRPVMAGGPQTTGTPRRVLWERYRTWAIIAPLFVAATLCGPLTIALLCGYICWQGAREYAELTKLPDLHRYVVVAGGWLTLLGMLVFGREGLMVTPLIAFGGVAALALYPAKGEQEVGERFRLAQATLWGYLYLGWLPAHLLGLGLGNLPGLVLLVGTGVALSDVGAFCAGKAIGGPKLAPKLSPNKSWGGVLGSFLGAGLATVLVVLALSLGLEWWRMGLLAAIIGLGSIWGDLLESLIKRQRGVKDAGGLLPGFGGLLDRIDSLLLVAPLVYYLVLIWK